MALGIVLYVETPRAMYRVGGCSVRPTEVGYMGHDGGFPRAVYCVDSLKLFYRRNSAGLHTRCLELVAVRDVSETASHKKLWVSCQQALRATILCECFTHMTN